MTQSCVSRSFPEIHFVVEAWTARATRALRRWFSSRQVCDQGGILSRCREYWMVKINLFRFRHKGKRVTWNGLKCLVVSCTERHEQDCGKCHLCLNQMFRDNLHKSLFWVGCWVCVCVCVRESRPNHCDMHYHLWWFPCLGGRENLHKGVNVNSVLLLCPCFSEKCRGTDVLLLLSERERGRERDCVYVCVYACASVCVCVCDWKHSVRGLHAFCRSFPRDLVCWRKHV